MTWWTNQKEKQLATMYPCEPREMICAAFPDHSWDAIRAHASKLKLGRDPLDRIEGLHPIIETLRRTRKARGLSQDAVAESVGIKRVSINHMERGKYLPNMRYLEPWCAAVGLKLTVTDEQP